MTLTPTNITGATAMEPYGAKEYKEEMSKVIESIWTSNMGPCPLSASQIEQLSWECTEVEIPVVYYSHLGVRPDIAGLSEQALAGFRLWQICEGYSMIEMLTDMGVFCKSDVSIRKGEPPLVMSVLMFPTQQDLDDIDDEQYRLLIGTCILGWANLYIKPHFSQDMEKMLRQTQSEMAHKESISSDSSNTIHTGTLH